MTTKPQAELYVSGLLKLKPSHHQFRRVTAKQFWAGLSIFKEPLLIDTRLDESHGLVNYYLNPKTLDTYRRYGFKTPQIGYIHYNEYILHEILINSIELNPNAKLSIQTTPIEDIKKTLPELLAMVGCPPSRKIYMEKQLQKLKKVGKTIRTQRLNNNPNSEPTPPNNAA